MVKILKTPLPKHEETLSPFIRDFVQTASSTPLPLLPKQLSNFPSRWPFPRDDLYHWIPLLNRFDTVLEEFCTLYGLHEGPQTRDFTCQLLERDAQHSQSLQLLGYDEDGDRQVIESILDFSRLLLENCGNRTIYASSPLLSDLLNSTSLSLIISTLQIGTQLAQRYQASFKRLSAPYRQHNTALLAIHYNINLDRVQQLAQPFMRTTVSVESVQPTILVTTGVKGKDRASFNAPSSTKTSVATTYANELVSIARGGPLSNNSPNGHKTSTNLVQNPSLKLSKDDWGDIRVTYYEIQPQGEHESSTTPSNTVANPLSSAPPTPTPVRRTSTMGHQHGQRSSRLSNTDDPVSPVVRVPIISMEDTQSSKPKTVEIPSSKVVSTPIHELLKEYMPDLPVDSKYELLTKLRVAKALTSTLEARRQLLAVRILSVTNLAYIHTETTFLEKVLKQDSDEPRRLQLIYQLADMIHPPAEGQADIPRSLQTIALAGLDALAGYQTKFQDICIALNTNINHGVLLYIVRKAVAEMAVDETGDKVTEKDEWRGAVFSLLSHVATLPRAGSDMVTAGLVPILIEVLKMRTSIAERNYPMILDFLDAFIFNVRDAFQILVSADGLPAISDLIVHEVRSASEAAKVGQGMQPECRSQSIDYEIPYFQQQSIKWLFKFIHHMMTTAGGYGGNFDRLLRNLIDSSPLLASLREIIGHANCFGSTVWTNAVRILNDFINNEPTSFAVIAEAGLSREFLQAITGDEVKIHEETKESQIQSDVLNDASSPAHTDDESIMSTSVTDDIPHPPTMEMLEAPREGPLAQGIIPSAEAINIIPAAFGAICLNSSGMKMFQESNALQRFFEVFESPRHVQCLETDQNLAANLGATFDELVRHHPPLKTAIMNATLDMVARVAHLCNTMVSTDSLDAKLWTSNASGQVVVADGNFQKSPSDNLEQTNGKGKAASNDTDIEMNEFSSLTSYSGDKQANAEKQVAKNPAPYIYVVATFLSAMFSNLAVRIAFMEKGGNEFVLDLADLPSLPYDFGSDKASRVLHSVIALLAEQKPHLILPSLLKRAQAATDILTPFARYTQRKLGKAYFAPFVTAEAIELDDTETLDRIASGTLLVKSFVRLHSHVAALDKCLQPQGYSNHRSSVPSFTQVNLTDYYVQLIKSLGPLLAAATTEEFILTKGGLVPPYWKKAVASDNSRSFEIDPLEEFTPGETRTIITDATTGIETVAVDTVNIEDRVGVNNIPSQPGEKPSSSSQEAQTVSKKERDSPRFKNFKTLQYLLSKLPFKISVFFQSLGRVSITKRSHEPLQRLSSGSIPEAIAESIDTMLLSTLDDDGSIENYNSWTVMISILRDVLVGPRQHDRPFEIITAVLQAFKERGGFVTLNRLLNVFTDDIKLYSSKLSEENNDKNATEHMRLDVKHGLSLVGAKHILDLYALLVTGKNIVEAPQTVAMSARSDRERPRNEQSQFSTPQFLVELRMAVLPTIRHLWESDIVEKAINHIPNRIIDIIRVIAVADHEAGAHKRDDTPQVLSKTNRKPWKPNTDSMTKLLDSGISEDLAKEALYRCNNSYTMASEYCKAQKSERSSGRNPIPQGVMDHVSDTNGSSQVLTGPSTGSSTPVITEPPTMQLDELVSEVIADASSSEQMGPPVVPNDPMAMSIDTLPGAVGRSEESTEMDSASLAQQTPLLSSQQPLAKTAIVTVDDLNEERAAIRTQLIERCLDVINAHGEVTFEIADLITTVVDKSDDPSTMLKDIGETLVNALMSFAMEDDVREVGKKVAAYAHLLALMLQNKAFYKESIGSLKDNLGQLIDFVKLSPTHSSEESSPWVAHILLIIEILLSQDAQPQETRWTHPTLETATIDRPVLNHPDPVVSLEHQALLFDNIVEILPRIGKDDSLALAVLRILVILTRTRDISVKMGAKKNIQRLFVMAKQLAGATSTRLQSPLMLILRHIIEDEETVKQIMRSEIKAFFDQPRTQRHIDVSTYLRQLSHLVIRAPILFVQVTNEMVKLGKWSSTAADSPGRQQIVMQEMYTRTHRAHLEETTLPSLQATGLLLLGDSVPTTEATTRDSPDAVKPALVEHKFPVVENPDGVIHFLLCELLNYKDVEDKDAAIQSTEKQAPESSVANGDATIADGISATTTSTANDAKDPKKSGKQEFKVEEHPIYIYRCFLLQCLTELLSCYNRTKIEFINFKRNAPPQPMTPTKPRSSVVNYLLSDLIPIGTLDHAETTALRKKMATSSWADSLLTALLSKTGEQLVDRDRDPTDADDEPDLLFVRKFVLENILKAYKDASASSEPLDIKYARMLSLADLMNHIMQSKETPSIPTDPLVSNCSTQQLRRIMFDKGFIAALTGSIADIDLNFPGAKRAVKHILRPLKTLTQTAIDLSDAGKISIAPSQGEEDEIASSSSVSDLDEGREETPDLFRNSTLGMFEPGRDENTSSESEDDDEDMYEGEYDDEEIEYGEEIVEDDEDNISDEDDDLEGMGEIEGLSGDHAVDVEVIMEDDDEDDDDEEEEENSEDDDDDDSDDMDGADDEDARVEIVDEEGNTHPLGEGDEGEEWQSDDDEEEDYEGRGADAEEVHDHEMGHIARGAIGHLVRALGGDDHEGAVEILQRIEDEGLDEEQMELEGYLEDGQDEDDDEEDDDDMDDDDGMYDDYADAPPGMAFEWNGEVVEPPLPMIIGHRGHHRPRHGGPSPFGYFTAGARDPLGGMLTPLPELLSFPEMESLAAAGIDHAQSALSRAQTEVEGGDHLGNALSTARSALQEARARLATLQGLVSGVVTLPTNFNTNAPSVPDVYRGFSPYRSHRPGPAPRGNDDGMNPLLQRSTGLNLSRDASVRPGTVGGPLATIRAGDGLSNANITATGPFGEGPAAILNDLITSLPLPGHLVARNGHQLHFQFTGAPRSDMSRDLQALFGMTRGGIPRADGRREPIVEPGNAASFSIRSTAARWTEEAKILFGNAHPEKAYQRVQNAIMAVLVPPAIKSEIEARKVAEEMKKKREEEERREKEAKEKREAEEKAEKEKQEAEEREALERVRAEEAAAAGAATASNPVADDLSELVTAEPMDGVEFIQQSSATTIVEEAAPDGERPRITTIIRGNQIDITDLGIDPDFLQELPDDIREEVITSTIAERRSQATAAGAEPSEIDQEFLDALPAEIRDEIIQQERQDRRRREREEQRRQAAANGSGASAAGPQEMDAASILATLPPALRQQILMEQPEEILNHLGPDFIAQARAGARDLPLSHVRNMAAGRPRAAVAIAGGVDQSIQKPLRRTTVQMLDKAGVATLLRLMFVFQQDSLRSTLFQVLQNVSENRHNRSEVIGTLLHILQDGSTDMTAVERSFAHLSLRAKQPKEKESKTLQPLKRTLTGMSLSIVPNNDVSPLMVVQQCLSTLIYLAKVNQHVPSFFLTEHDASGGLKRSTSRKGKGKDTRASKYALNSLLTLLDRKLIMESSSVMESLSDLLSRITLPLQALERKQKEAAEEARKLQATVSATGGNASETVGETISETVPEMAPETVLETAIGTEPNTEPMETDGDGIAPFEPVADVVPVAENSTIESGDTNVPIVEQPEKPIAIEEKDAEPKKQRPFIPPVIPEANLKLVINIFVARECSAKTFRETLSTIKNLSCIPGAKEVFGKELIRKAQELGDSILFDLEDLLPQIQKASSGTEIQGVALANFSPSGSDQNKLLRVLTALDHLFDPKNTPKKDTSEGDSVEGADNQSKDVEKQDLLAALYENPTFGPMWEKLSACLSAIRQRENMLNVATILLPLIESLMVVCKNTTIKDTPILRSQIGREMSITSPQPESRMENLFFTFTEEHRKILNDLVRHSPKLMSGTFALLVKNPKVLEFDNKRNYFTRSIHNRTSQSRQSFPPLQLSVRREQVFHDSFKSLYFKSGDEMKFGKLSIRFHGEEGVDAGGVTREWFQVLSRQMFDPGYALFIPVSSDRTTFHPRHTSSVNPEHLLFFKFIGRIIGKALYEGRVLDCHFSRAVYKRILGKAVSVKDMESLDPEYYKSLVWMLENDITDIITETFSVDNDKFGITETVDLIENGRNILVTQDNKQEYIRLIVEFKLIGSVQEQLDNFLKGFHEIIPAELVAIFNEQELELLISGLPEIDVDDWKSNTEYHNYTGASPQIQWFWRAIRSFDKEERAKLLQFVTGTSKVPLNGFKELEGMNGFSRFNIHRDYGNKDRLPSSHTCFNQLDLPEYENYETLRQQVLTAITAGSEYFGFA